MYTPITKTVIDCEAVKDDATHSLEMAVLQFVLANTARQIQLDEIPEVMKKVVEKFVEASSITVKVTDKAAYEICGLSFMKKYNKDRYLTELSNLLIVLADNNCWYEDRIDHHGFCWRNREEKFCTIEIEI